MRAEIAAQRARARGEHDVIHGGRVGVLHALHVGELDAAQRYRAPTGDAPVEPSARSAGQRKLAFREGGEREPRPRPRGAQDLPRAAQRLRAERERGVREQRRGRGSRLRLGLRLRGAARAGVAIDVQQSAHELRAADAVDGGVMDLGHEREAAALEPLDHPHLPERAIAAQRHLGDPRDRLEQLARPLPGREAPCGAGARRDRTRGRPPRPVGPSASGTSASLRRRIGSPGSRRSICARMRRKSSRGPRPCDSSTSAPITCSGASAVSAYRNAASMPLSCLQVTKPPDSTRTSGVSTAPRSRRFMTMRLRREGDQRRRASHAFASSTPHSRACFGLSSQT